MTVGITRYSGPTAFVVGWAIWLTCLSLAPVRPIFVGDVVSVGIFVLANVALFAGLFSFRLFETCFGRTPSVTYAVSVKWIDRVLVPALAFLSLLALACRGIDYFLIRHISLALTENQVREVLVDSKPNAASAIYILLSPAAYAAGILALLRMANGARNLIHLVAISTFLITPSMSVIFGGRSVLVLVFSIAGLAVFLSIRKVSWPFVATAFLASGCLFLATMLIFLRRLPSGLGLDQLMLEHGFAKHVPATVSALTAIRDSNPAMAAFAYYSLTASQYVLHGVFEFFVVVRQKSAFDPLLLGRYEFDLINRVWRWIAIEVGHPISSTEQFDPRSGVFSSFWGPAYVDFGIGMVLVGYCWGVIVDYFRVQVARGDLLALPFYVLSLVQLTMSPLTNGFSMAGASYINLGLLLLWLVGRYSAVVQSNRFATVPSSATGG